MLGWGIDIKPRGAVTAAILVLIAGPTAALAQDKAGNTPATIEILTAEGASIYRNRCERCHGRNGQGQRQGHDAAPRLGGHFAHLSVSEITVRVRQGGAYMPPFGDFTNREIAAVATYVRNAFGNNRGIASEEEVAKVP